MKSLIFASLVVLFASFPAGAQVVRRMDGAQSQALIERDEKGFLACGIRTIILDTEALEIYDISLRVIRDTWVGIVEGRKGLIAKGKLKPNQPSHTIVTPAPNKFWIAKETSDSMLSPTRGYGDSKTPGLMLAPLPVFSTLEIISGIYKGERVQFVLGYPRHEKEGDRIISFKAPLPKEEQVALDTCMTSLRKGAKSAMKEDNS